MNPIIIFAATFALFLLVIAGMAVGVMMGRRQISGSCGGLANQGEADGSTSCSLCSNPSEACSELRKRAEQAKQNASCAEEECGEGSCEDHAAACGESTRS